MLPGIAMQIHITGASGSGTTTLGLSLCERLDAAHYDSDDYYWLPTDPPYAESRPVSERLELLMADLREARDWVLSGSLCGWGDPLIPRFDLVVFLYVPTGVRLTRLRDRETRMFGSEALAPGGRMHENHVAFLEWAASYDEGGPDVRSLERHSDWLESLPCAVLRLEGEMATSAQVEEVMSALEAKLA